MDNIEIRVDDPEIEITDEYSVDYDLPIASATTLGGVKIGSNVDIDSDGKISIPVASAETAGVVKVGTNLSIDENGVLSATGGASITVDSTLSTVSTNPVQNKVITSEINSINTTVGTIQSSITAINGSIDDLNEALGTTNTNVATNAGNITNLQTAVQTNTDNISTNTSNIGTNTLDITNIKGRLDDAEDAITGLGNGLSTLQGTVDPLVVRVTEEAQYSDITTGTWTSGSIQLFKRGYMGVIYSTLEGSLTIGANSSEVLYTMQDTDYLPTYEATGYIISDLGMIRVGFNTSGEFKVFNDNASSITITELKGNLPIVFV